MRWLADHPTVQALAALGAVAGLLFALVQWRWHVSDERHAAFQQVWFEADKWWNEEALDRLANIEAAVEECGRR